MTWQKQLPGSALCARLSACMYPSTVAHLLSTENSYLVTQDSNVVPVCPAVCYFQFHG